ncbi:MAG: FAD-binding protein [Candidatus Faecalibacterium intestinavium]|uniref:Urocanate reductase n=1 Tax=Candidatus Faecalibacterium intestinavium TaxID=2838580 RepID=A0A9E2KLE2_9FIRM|nr:FAD-binding protein [Candidatus Faecalibacterium intestinavium]
MRKTLNRREFLKRGTVLGMGAAALGALTGCNAASSSEAAASSVAGIYTPGTYTAAAKGMNGDVTATVTFDETRITEVVLDVSGETESIGQAAKDKLIEQIMTAQTSQIDGVTGATVTSKAVQNAVADCISQASGGAITPAQQDTSEASGADWLGQEPEIAESEITETRECEVLVVGAGSSGSFAAASAVEMGAKTILIEKFGHDMASGIRDTLAGCGSREQKADGDDVDKAEAVQYLCDWSHSYTKRSLAKLWAEKSGETMDWFADRLEEGGLSFRHEIDDASLPSNYKVLDVGHSTQYGEEYYDQLTMDIVLEYAQGLGLEVQYEITMVKLEKDGDRVCGLIAKDANGSYIRYKASKGVILACGGYSGNEEMMMALQPHSVEQTCINYSKPGSKGDGIKACLWAGAIMDTTHTSMIFDRGAVKPDEHGEYGKASNGQLFWMGSQPFLKVNLKGERFMNEYQPYDMILHSAASQPYHTYCTVWDSNYVEDCKTFETHGCSRLYEHKNGTAPVFTMDMVIGMNAELEENGYIVKADTIEELAEKLNLPADAFKATVERYNELAAKGVDEDFGKEGYRMSALAAAPFYGVRQSGGYLICTMDGIQIDENMHALNTEYEPIAGLYVIGDMSGNYFSQSYPCLLAGAAAGRSATFGRLAGQNAAQGI